MYEAQGVIASSYNISWFCVLDQAPEIPPSSDHRETDEDYDQDDDADDLETDDDDDDDFYALLVIPILGFIGGIAAFIIRRFKDRLLMILLERIFDCLGSDEGNKSHMADTDSTSVESTCPKERAVNLKFSSENLSSTYPETSLSGDTWNDRTQTDARKIFDNMREERKIATDVSSSLIEVLDKAT